MGEEREPTRHETPKSQGSGHSASRIECSSLLTLLPDHILLLDASFRIWHANFASHGFTVAQLIGSYLPAYVDEEERPVLEETLRGVLETGQPAVFEAAYRPPQGPPAVFESHVRPYQDGLLVLAHDITKRKTAEVALRESERILNETGRMARIGGWEHDLREDKAVWTRALYDILGMDPESDPPGPSGHWAYYPEPHRSVLREAYDRTVREGVPFDLELQIRTAPDRLLWVRATGESVREDGQCVRLRGTFQDIDAQKTAELARQESDRTLQTLMANLPGMAYRCTNAPSCSMDFVSEGALAVTGYTEQELMGPEAIRFNDLIVAEERFHNSETIRQQIACGEPFELEYRIHTKQGEERWVRERGRAVAGADDQPVVLEGFITDITAQRTLEAQIRQNQRLESIGTLASGVAHEINNPLMGMINYAELIQSDTTDERLGAFAREIVREGTRVARIVRSLLSFARHQPEETSVTSLHDIVAASLSLLGAALRRDGIDVTLDIPSNLPSLRCRSQQIEQVFVNLLTNAQASLNSRFPEHDDGKVIRITAATRSRGKEEWIRATVEDHGEGIPARLLDRVFDPFVSGRTKDSGTGLGLSISHGIVKAHGGDLSVESDLGRFARFHVDLPTGS